MAGALGRVLKMMSAVGAAQRTGFWSLRLRLRDGLRRMEGFFSFLTQHLPHHPGKPGLGAVLG